MINNTGLIRLWTCCYNVKTEQLKEISHELDEEYADLENQLEKADYDGFEADCVYAESITSEAAARNVVMNKLRDLSNQFTKGFHTIRLLNEH